jgi:curved DNA-binding protein CbpA
MTLKEAAQILELTPPFSREDLKKAFRDAVMVWHPDRFPEGTERRAKAEKRTQQVNDAYDLLSRLPDSDFPIRGEGWTESTAAASPPKRTEKDLSGMSSKRFSILIAAGILCALFFSAPGLYRLSKDYEKDKVIKEASKPKDNSWHATSRSAEYQSLTAEKRAEMKSLWFEQHLLPEIERESSLKKIGREKMLNWFMQQPDDNGQGYFTSFLGSFGRGAFAILPWSLAELATLRELAGSVRGTVEGFFPVNPVHVEKWPMKLAFWLGFSSPPAAFFLIRAKRKKAFTTAPPAPPHSTS